MYIYIYRWMWLTVAMSTQISCLLTTIWNMWAKNNTELKGHGSGLYQARFARNARFEPPLRLNDSGYCQSSPTNGAVHPLSNAVGLLFCPRLGIWNHQLQTDAEFKQMWHLLHRPSHSFSIFVLIKLELIVRFCLDLEVSMIPRVDEKCFTRLFPSQR